MKSLIQKLEKPNQDKILKMHKILLTCIHNDWAGHYRNGNVEIAGANFQPPPAAAIRRQMNEFTNWLLATKKHPVLVAAEAHYRFVYIHPFADGNGRISRVLMNLLLMKEGHPLTVIKAENKKAYLKALREADNGNKEAFYLFIAKAVLEAITEYEEHLSGKAEKKEVGSLGTEEIFQ